MKSLSDRILDPIRSFLTRVRFLFRFGAKANLNEELQHHLDQSIQAYIASGMSASQARKQTLVDFGGVEQTREETYRLRPGWLLETVLQDLRYASRGFRRNPSFAATVIVTLALGIGATTAVFSVIDPILFRPLPYAHGDRLVSVGLTAPINPQEFVLGGSYYVWRDNQTPFEALTAIDAGDSTCDLTEHNPIRLDCAHVEANFLPTLGIAPLLGRNFLPEEDRPNGPKAALLTYSLWKSRYAADPSILNRLIDVDGIATRVVGVLPEDFEMPTLEAADIVLPQALDEAAERKADPGRVMFAFARLKPGVTPQQAAAALQPLFAYSRRLVPAAFRNEVHLRVRSLRDRQIHDVRLTAWTLFCAVLAVLIIACANVASLMLARGRARERELAVRSALGASQGRLVRQTLTEALLLSFAGAVAGWGLAEILLRVFISLAPAAMPFVDRARLDLRIVAVTILLACLCGLAFGLISARQHPRAEALAIRSVGTGNVHSWLRGSIVVTQIAISLMLLSASTLLVRSLWKLQHHSLGMHSRALITATIELGHQRYSTEAQQMQFFNQAEASLRRLPGVNTVAIADSVPPAGMHHESILNVIAIAGRPPAQSSAGTGGMVAWRWVSPEYFRALHIPILAGRNFTDEERRAGEHLVILSRALADRIFPGQDPIGQRIRPAPSDFWFTVTGIAANVTNAGLTGQDEPEYYRLRPTDTSHLIQGPDGYSTLIAESSLAPAAVEPWIRAQIAAIDPTVPVQIETLNQRVGKLAAVPRFQAALLAFFAFTGLVMALIGLYGLTSYLAQRRTQEIGVRMALGAGRGDILRLVAWEGVRLIALGGVVGVAISLAVTQMLKSLLFETGPRDPYALVTASAVLALTALAATLIPARKAMRLDPVEALRCE